MTWFTGRLVKGQGMWELPREGNHCQVTLCFNFSLFLPTSSRFLARSQSVCMRKPSECMTACQPFCRWLFEVWSLSSPRTPKSLGLKDKEIDVVIPAACRTGSAAWCIQGCHGEQFSMQPSNWQVKLGVCQFDA